VHLTRLCAFGAYGSPGSSIGYADTPRLIVLVSPKSIPFTDTDKHDF
jgi:hypothetical protein